MEYEQTAAGVRSRIAPGRGVVQELWLEQNQRTAWKTDVHSASKVQGVIAALKWGTAERSIFERRASSQQRNSRRHQVPWKTFLHTIEPADPGGRGGMVGQRIGRASALQRRRGMIRELVWMAHVKGPNATTGGSHVPVGRRLPRPPTKRNRSNNRNKCSSAL